MRKYTVLIASTAIAFGLLGGIAGAGSAPNTLIHTSITHKHTQYFHVASSRTSGTAKCKRDKRPWYTCGLGGETLRNLSSGLHTFRAKAIYNGIADPTPAVKTFRVN
jgi:hypothetical protein